MASRKGEQDAEYEMRVIEPKGLQSTDELSIATDAYRNSSNEKIPLFRRIIDSFKPYDLEKEHIDTTGLSQVDKVNIATSRHPLARKLKGRHLQMISFGGSIGTGLFISSGYSLWKGGPAGQLISYFLVGFAVFCMSNAVGEMAVQYPTSGAFHVYYSRFIDPSFGFAIGMNYALAWLLSVPSELVACSLTIGNWNNKINPSVWVAIFYVLIISINLFGVKGFGEIEFVLSLIKVIAVIGFIIVGISLICGAGKKGYIGTQYWHNPGSFNHGLKGLCSCFITANFTFGGVELTALAAAETINPRISLPRATKQVFWRLALFYIATSVIIGCLVPYNDGRLLSGKSSVDITASPFVIAIRNGGINVLPDIMNAVILISVVSVCNSAIYACSRTLSALAVQGMLPQCIAYIDRMGRPIVAIAISSVFGLLGFLAADAKHQGEVFTWLFSVCGMAFTWLSICITHLRFRWALDRQGRDLDEVLFISPTGVWGSAIAIVIFLLVNIGIVWTAIWPIGSHGPDNKSFWKNCLVLPVVILLWAGHKTYTRTWNQLLVDSQYVDLDAGRRNLNIDVVKQEVANEREKLLSKPLWYRVYRVWC